MYPMQGAINMGNGENDSSTLPSKHVNKFPHFQQSSSYYHSSLKTPSPSTYNMNHLLQIHPKIHPIHRKENKVSFSFKISSLGQLQSILILKYSPILLDCKLLD